MSTTAATPDTEGKGRKKSATMSEDELASLVANHIRDALAYDDDALSNNRAEAIRRYEGDPYGDERADRSKLVSRDVFEAVESLMPALVRTFLGSDDIVKFEPTGPEDEAVAKQATEYVNWCILKDNDGFRLIHDWMKTTLLHKNGVAKVSWDETITATEAEYEGLTDDDLVVLIKDDDVEIKDYDQAEDGTYRITAKHTDKQGRVRLEVLAPEEFLINRRAKSLDDADFMCHRVVRTRSELIQAGYDRAKIDQLPDEGDDDWHEETRERFDELEFTANSGNIDKSRQRHWIYEAYVELDYDGDDVSEWRRVVFGGNPSAPIILEHDNAPDVPFAVLTCVIHPHRFHGISVFDQIGDLQRAKTVLRRMMMDGLYHTLYPRRLVGPGVEIDDVMNQAPDSIIRTKNIADYQQVQNNWDGAKAFPMLQYLDDEIEGRTGVTALSSGLDANVLQNQSATAVNEASQAAKSRVELMARVFAETGFTRLFRLVLRTVARYQDRARTVRLTGGWVPVDPRQWNTDMDVSVNVGLGVNSRDREIQILNMIAQKQEAILMQAGPGNPLVGMKEYHNTLSRMVNVAGMPAADAFFKDPGEQPVQPQGPSPEAQKAQAEMQMKQAELQMKAQQAEREAVQHAEIEQLKAQNQAQIEQFKAELAAQVDRERMEMQATLDREKMQLDHAFRQNELDKEADLEMLKMRAGSPDGQGNINVSD